MFSFQPLSLVRAAISGSRLSQTISAASLGAIDVDYFLESLESAGSTIFPKLLGGPQPIVPKYIPPTPNAAAVRKAKPAPSSASYNILASQNLSLKRRIRSLEADNLKLCTAVQHLEQKLIDVKDDHEHAKMMLTSDLGALEHEMTELKAKYYTGISNGRALRKGAKDASDELVMLRDKLTQAEKFISAMVEINAGEPVFRRAAQAFKDGKTVEDALFDSITDAANNGGSLWSRFMPCIVELGTRDHSLVPFNSHRKALRELQDRENAIQICKQPAQTVPKPSSTATPSSLDDVDAICDAVVEEQEHQPHILEDPFNCSKNGEDIFFNSFSTPSRSAGLATTPSLDKTTRSPFVEVDFNRRTDLFNSSESLVETPTKPSAKVLSKRRATMMKTKRVSTSPICSPKLRKVVPRVPDELFTLTDSRSRRVMSLDTNLALSAMPPCELAIGVTSKAVPNTKLLTTTQPESSDPFTKTEDEAQLAEPCVLSSFVKVVEVVAKPGLSPPAFRNTLYSPATAVKGSSFLAVQALQSLERICAAFSSDTLGSLEMTETGSESESELDIETLLSTIEQEISSINNTGNAPSSGSPTTPQIKRNIADQDETPKVSIIPKFVSPRSIPSPSSSKMKQPSYRSPAALSKAASTRSSPLLPHSVFRDPASALKPRIDRTQQSPNIPSMPLSSMHAVGPLIGSDASRASGHAISTPSTCDFLPTASQPPVAKPFDPLERRIHYVLEPTQPLRIVKKSAQKPSPVIQSPPLSNFVPPTASGSSSPSGLAMNIAIPSNNDPVPAASHTRHSSISQTPLAESLNPVQRRIQYVLEPTQPLRIVKKSAQKPPLATQRPPLSNVTNIAAPTSSAKPSIDKSKTPSVNTRGSKNENRPPTASKTRPINRTASVINPVSTRPLTRFTHKTIGSNDFGSITIIRNTPIDSPPRSRPAGTVPKTPPLTSIPKLISRKTQNDDILNKAATARPKKQYASPPLRSALDSNNAPSPLASDRQPILKSNLRLSISSLASRAQQVTWSPRAVEVLATNATPSTPSSPAKMSMRVNAQSSFQVDAKNIHSPLAKLRMSLSPSSRGVSGNNDSNKLRATQNAATPSGTTNVIGQKTITPPSRGILRRLSAAIS